MKRSTSNDIARNILAGRPYENLSFAIKKFERIALMFGLASLFFLVLSFFKENQLYQSYAIYSILQIVLILVGSYLFKKFHRLRWLLLIVMGYFLLYSLERYFLGVLIEPMKGTVPTLVGPHRSPGLVKFIALLLPSLYFWTKILLGFIWVVIFLMGLRLKGLKF